MWNPFKRKIKQHYFRVDKIDEKKKQGWKLVKEGVGQKAELALMEKKES